MTPLPLALGSHALHADFRLLCSPEHATEGSAFFLFVLSLDIPKDLPCHRRYSTSLPRPLGLGSVSYHHRSTVGRVPLLTPVENVHKIHEAKLSTPGASVCQSFLLEADLVDILTALFVESM